MGAILAGCPDPEPDPLDELRPDEPPAEEMVEVRTATHDAFFSHLLSLCERAFRGVVVDATPPIDDPFLEAELVMHVRECEDDEIEIPFHVGEDRSRTWVLTRTDAGLRLKHDHRHEDGTEEEITWYGGDTEDQGTAFRQEFHADEHTAELVPEAATNVWTMELLPEDDLFVYDLRREGTDRRFRAEFDLGEEVPPPPPPWGH